MSDQAAVLAEPIGEALTAWASTARERLTIVAPFIKRKAIERLASGVGPAVRLTVVTRWRVEEICAGVSDLDVLDFVGGRPSGRLLLHPSLHAKVVLVDDAVACVGSANITDAALGFASAANLEVMVALRPVPNRLFVVLSRIERGAVPATDELRRRFEEAARTVPAAACFPDIPLATTLPQQASPFPRLRTPEQLYRGYVSVVDFRDEEARAAVLDDLSWLDLPDHLDEPGFRQHVGAALLANRLLSDFDGFVAQPRHFGEMAGWLKGRVTLPGEGVESRKLYLQTLIRWLRFFLPGRYALEQPGYSEVFRRASD